MIAPASRKLGKYEIRQKLGRGGMADVYLAQDTESGQTVEDPPDVEVGAGPEQGVAEGERRLGGDVLNNQTGGHRRGSVRDDVRRRPVRSVGPPRSSWRRGTHRTC